MPSLWTNLLNARVGSGAAPGLAVSLPTQQTGMGSYLMPSGGMGGMAFSNPFASYMHPSAGSGSLAPGSFLDNIGQHFPNFFASQGSGAAPTSPATTAPTSPVAGAAPAQQPFTGADGYINPAAIDRYGVGVGGAPANWDGLRKDITYAR